MAASECTTYMRPVLKGYDPGEKVMYLYQPRCKMWKCPACAEINKQQWCARIGEGYEKYISLGVDGWRFWTVTSSPKNKTLSQCLYVWPKAWAKFSRRIRYHYPGIRYVLLPEQHEDGRLHIHAIASHGVTTRFVKDHGHYSGLGYKNESETIRDKSRCAYYVTKYLNKSIVQTKWPSNFRRIRTSQNWPQLEDRDDFDGLNVEWEYLSTYPADGLEYLAKGLREKNRVDVRVLR